MSTPQTGHDLYEMWVNAPGSSLRAYWSMMNALEKAKWDTLARRINRLRAERDELSTMLGRLLDVALVDGYGEAVADEARGLLAGRSTHRTEETG